jgi:hypothetical protein
LFSTATCPGAGTLMCVGQNTERWLSIARASWRYCPRCIERTELCRKSGQRTVGNGDSHHLACQSLGLREEVFVARASMNARGSSRAGRTATLTVRHRRKRYFSRCPVLNSAYLDRRGRVRLPQLPCLVFLGKPMGTDAMRLDRWARRQRTDVGHRGDEVTRESVS